MAKSHPEYDSLLAAVCAAPDDDTPRLVLADWLDEHDDPDRAAYLRAETQLHRLCEDDPHAAAAFSEFVVLTDLCRDPASVSPTVARMAELQQQSNASADAAQERWEKIIGKRGGRSVRQFARGFPSVLEVSSARQFARKRAPEPLPGYILDVRADDPGFDALLTGPGFTGAGGVSVSGVADPAPVRKLGARAAVRNFRSLALGLYEANPDILTAVAEQPNWSALTALELTKYGSDSSADLPATFATATHLRGLTELELNLKGVSGAGLAHLTRLGLPRVRRLALAHNPFGAAGAKELLGGAFPELRKLDLRTCALGAEGGRTLAGARSELATVATLELGWNDITDPVVAAELIAGPCFPNLVGLSLYANRFTELDGRVLAAPGRGPTLRTLGLTDCGLSATAARALCLAPALADLTYLSLAGNETGDALVSAVAGGKWNRLSGLSLAGNEITADGVRELVAWPGSNRLRRLDLRHNRIGLAGAKALAGAAEKLAGCQLSLAPQPEFIPPTGLELLRRTFGDRLNVG